MRKIYSALDIGSDTIKLVIGEFINDKLNVLCAIKKDSRGFKYNHITDKEKLISSINEVLDEAEEKLNFRVKNVILNIPANYNEFIVTERKNEIENEDGIVTGEDIHNIMQDSFDNEVKPNDELLCLVPVYFKIDNKEVFKPVGLKGKLLSLKSVLVTTDKKSVYDIINIVTKCGLNVVDIMPTGLVDYYNFKNDELDSKNVVVVNLGYTSSTISVMCKGIYINNIVIDSGAFDIDKEISLKYNLRRNEVVYLKEHLGLASMANVNEEEFIVVNDRDNNEVKVTQSELSEIINSKVLELLKIVKKNINHLTKKEISYIIITGGLSCLKDINLEVNSIFGQKGKIGMINNLGARCNSYSVALGMLNFFHSKLSIRNKEYMSISDEDLKKMIDNNKSSVTNDSIIGRIFNYFFDN